MPYNFVTDSFHTKKLYSRSSSYWSVILSRMQPFCFLESTFGAVRDNVRCSSWAHWKAHIGLPISVNWTSLARCYSWSATSANRLKIGDFAPMWPLWLKISGTRGRPVPIIFAWTVKPMNAYNFAADSFHIKKLCSTLSSREVRF